MEKIFCNYGETLAAVEANGNEITYREVFRISNEIWEVIGERTLVISLCSNTIGSVAGYVSFINHGIVPLLLADMIERTLLNRLIQVYRPEYLWLPVENSKNFPDYDRIYANCGYVLVRTGLKPYPMYEELALLLTTSGSTGSPKLVKQSYWNIKSNTEAIVEYLGIDSNERPITTLPMNYTYGLSILNTHLYMGATMLLIDEPILQKGFWDFFRKKEATSFGGVPYTYEILDKLQFYHMELPSLRYMTQAGGKLLPELHRKIAEYAQQNGKKFVVMYGQTEATARMGYLPANKALEKCGSMGIAIPGGKFELVDIDGNLIIEPDMVGELVYRGENVTLGYAQKGDDLLRGDERQGVLATGDMAKRDADGFYYIVGRKKRFLKIYGNRVNLDEVERMLKSAFQNIECACGGKDDKLIIYVVPESFKEDMEVLRRYLMEMTRLHITAFHILEVQEIPQNDSGKILYAQLEDQKVEK